LYLALKRKSVPAGAKASSLAATNACWMLPTRPSRSLMAD
jgi:hypothetical protein